MTQLNIVAIVEVRMTSSRLPGKHFLQVNDKPILQHLVERLKTVENISRVVLATTENSTDDVIVELASKLGVDSYRGSELDVMGRVLGSGEKFNADVICEVTGDCSIIDVALVDQLIETYLLNSVDYVSDGQSGLPVGMTSQVFSLNALRRSYAMTQDLLDLEHVTLHIRRNPDIFSSIYIVAPNHLRWPELMLTLDEKDDYVLLKKIIEHFGNEKPFFNCLDVIKLIRKNLDWICINQHVIRKGDT